MFKKGLIISIASCLILLTLGLSIWGVWYNSEIISNTSKLYTSEELDRKKQDGKLKYKDEIDAAVSDINSLDKELVDSTNSANDSIENIFENNPFTPR